MFVAEAEPEPEPEPELGRRQSLLAVRDAVAAYAGAYDPRRLGRAALQLEQQRVIETVNMLCTLRALNAARLAEFGSRDEKGQALRDLAQASGTSLKQAERAIATGRALLEGPDLGQAARSGQLSADQLAIIAETAAECPGTAARLVRMAPQRSLAELAAEAARLRSAGCDGEARRARVHARRALRQWTGPEGTWHLRAEGTPEAGAAVMAAINAAGDEAFQKARGQGRREAPEAYAFDGLVALAQGTGRKGTKVDLLVRIDHSVLMRGYALEGEVCDIAGFGPTTPQAVMELMEAQDPFISVVLTKGDDVVGVTNLGRRPNKKQRTALDWVFPSCAAQGCAVRACWLQSDHREDWAFTHFTRLELLDRLCPHHHRLKTYKGWMLVEGKGKRPFVPPDDARHPRYRPPGQQPAAGPGQQPALGPGPTAAQRTGPSGPQTSTLDLRAG